MTKNKVCGKVGSPGTFRGGLPSDVFYTPTTQQYIQSGHVFGYLGSCERTVAMDKFVVNTLRKYGMGHAAIALWLTSTSGRHMMDAPSRGNIKEYLKRAPTEVCIWSDPEHDGSLGGTMRIAPKYKTKKARDEQLRKVEMKEQRRSVDEALADYRKRGVTPKIAREYLAELRKHL